MRKTVFPLPRVDGQVYKGCTRKNMPPDVASGILALGHDMLDAYGMVQLKKALQRTGFELSEAELCGIFEQDFGMKAEDAQRRAKLFFESLKAKS